MTNNITMRCAYLAAERGANMLPSATTPGRYTLTDVQDGSIILADVPLADVQAFCSQIDPSIAT